MERGSLLVFCSHLVKKRPALCQRLSSANYTLESNTVYEQLSQRSTSAQTSHIRLLHVHNRSNISPMTTYSNEIRAFCLCPSRHRSLSNTDLLTFHILHVFFIPTTLRYRLRNNPLTPQTSQLPRRSSETQVLNSLFRFHRAHEHQATIRSLA